MLPMARMSAKKFFGKRLTNLAEKINTILADVFDLKPRTPALNGRAKWGRAQGNHL